MKNNNWIIIGAGEFGIEIFNIFFKGSKKKLLFFVDDDFKKKNL